MVLRSNTTYATQLKGNQTQLTLVEYQQNKTQPTITITMIKINH